MIRIKEKAKRWAIVAAAVLLSVPIFAPGQSQAYNGGLLEGKAFTKSTSPNGTSSSLTNATDNNTTTGISVNGYGGYVEYTFSSPIDIGSIAFSGSRVSGSFWVGFYNEAGTQVLKKDTWSLTSTSADNPPVVTAITANAVKKIRVQNDAGGAYSLNEIDLYQAADKTPPAVPSGLAAVAGDGSVALSWTANTDADIKSYKVFRNSVLVATVTHPTNGYTDTGLTNGNTYTYELTAVDAANNESAKSATVNATPSGPPPPPPDTTPPAVPTNVDAVAGDGQAMVTWTLNGSDTTLYHIYQNGVYLNSVSHPTDTFVATGLTNGSGYSYQVAAEDAAGNESEKSAAVTVTPTAPQGPPGQVTNVTVTPMNGAVVVSWTAVAGATGYHVYQDGVQITTSPVTGTSYTVNGLTNGQQYTFTVVAINAQGAGPQPSNPPAPVAPSQNALPVITFSYSLADIADGVGEWFSGFWMILAFALSIPLSFQIGRRVKTLFE